MEEVTSNMTIAVIMDYLICHEMEYSGRKDPIFAMIRERRCGFSMAWGVFEKKKIKSLRGLLLPCAYLH